MKNLINISLRCKPENIKIGELKEVGKNFIVRLDSMKILVKPCEVEGNE